MEIDISNRNKRTPVSPLSLPAPQGLPSPPAEPIHPLTHVCCQAGGSPEVGLGELLHVQLLICEGRQVDIADGWKHFTLTCVRKEGKTKRRQRRVNLWT